MSPEQRLRLNSMIYSSTIDAGSIYFPDFGRIPSLNEILTLLQVKYSLEKREVTHDAIQDSLDVIVAIRCRFNNYSLI